MNDAEGTSAPALQNTEEKLPHEGGSYLRHEDGSLELVERTGPAKNGPATLPQAKE